MPKKTGNKRTEVLRHSGLAFSPLQIRRGRQVLKLKTICPVLLSRGRKTLLSGAHPPGFKIQYERRNCDDQI